MVRYIPAVLYGLAFWAFISAIGRMDVPFLQSPCLKVGFLLLFLGFLAEKRCGFPQVRPGEDCVLLLSCHWFTAAVGAVVFATECALGNFRLGCPIMGIALMMYCVRRAQYPQPPRDYLVYRGKRVWEMRDHVEQNTSYCEALADNVDWSGWIRVMANKPRLRLHLPPFEEKDFALAHGWLAIPTPKYHLAFEPIERKMA